MLSTRGHVDQMDDCSGDPTDVGGAATGEPCAAAASGAATGVADLNSDDGTGHSSDEDATLLDSDDATELESPR